MCRLEPGRQEGERRVLQRQLTRGDFYQLHTQYLAQGKFHAGIILTNQQQYSIGEQMRRILHLAAVIAPSLARLEEEER